MKTRTVEELVDGIAAELSWRKKELSVMQGLLRRSENNSAALEAVLRSAVLLLYAHWEGFIRETASRYLEFVERRTGRLEHLIPALVGSALRKRFESAVRSGHPSELTEIVSLLITAHGTKCRLPGDLIDTRSNLSSSVLKDLLDTLGLDYEPFRLKEKLIDANLLHHRNNIAHGSQWTPNLSRYREWHDEVLAMLEVFRNLVENAAIQKAYRRVA